MADAAAASTSTSPATPTSILICREDGNDIFFPDADDDGADFSVAADHRLLSVDQDHEYVAVLLSKESASPGVGAREEDMEEWMKAARSGCVRWIIKTTAMFRFGGKTAYVAVTYFDRFLAQRQVDRGKEWALQLLAVACLSLASKVEEYRSPRLSEFPLDAHDFDSASILRMELLVLATLQWRMITVTPFAYISCFAARFRPDERGAIILRAVECVFDSIKGPDRSFTTPLHSIESNRKELIFLFAEMSSVEYQPSTIALASILVARNKASSANLDELKAILGSSWPQLDTGHVSSCYSAMIIQEDKSSMHSTEVASSGVSVAAHVGSPDTSVNANNAAPATPDNKRKRLRSPQRQ
ncbi:hypothetical protein EJB05_07643 [Eragrostis curvula]|uniref:Cyclin-like domain-containing protein n=1 Tax=Eragrostis curvula TaxID=38414 RepID=A0A5J9WH44_9POAL|nr:hypothetical protein EJB05_07643 [Eragrostis curvula]